MHSEDLESSGAASRFDKKRKPSNTNPTQESASNSSPHPDLELFKGVTQKEEELLAKLNTLNTKVALLKDLEGRIMAELKDNGRETAKTIKERDEVLRALDKMKSLKEELSDMLK